MSEIWIDAQLSPSMAAWLGPLLATEAHPLRDLGLRDADDAVVFTRARAAGAVILTKDADFLLLLDRHGPPPRVIWLTCGNTSNDRLRELLVQRQVPLRDWLRGDAPLIEVGG